MDEDIGFGGPATYRVVVQGALERPFPFRRLRGVS